MRTDCIEVTFKIPFSCDKPDLNGVVHTKEAVKNAIMALIEDNNLSIIYRDNNKVTDGIVIGNTNDKEIDFVFNEDKQVYEVTIDGVIYHGGADIVVNKIDGNKITDFRITSFGISI